MYPPPTTGPGARAAGPQAAEAGPQGAAAGPRAPGSGRQGAVALLFGVAARGQTWRNFAYLWIAFPLGLAYVVFLVTGLSLGICLSVVVVGIPILLLMVAAWWALAAFERATARALLGAHVGPAPRPWERGEGTWGSIRAHLGAGSTWRDLAFLLLKLPMGVASLVLFVTGLAIVIGFVGAPLFQYAGAFTVAGQRVDSWAVAWLFVPLGVVALLLWLHVLNAWAWVSARLAEALLGRPTFGATAPVSRYGPPAQVAPPPSPASPPDTPASPCRDDPPRP